MTELKTQIVVIGSGSAGLTTSIGLAKIGYKVIVIEKELIGGDCTHFGCVPSKALLSRAKKFQEFKNYNKKININIDPLALKKQANTILEETRKVVWEFGEHESVSWLENNGVKIIGGEARFASEGKVEITKINKKNTSQEYKDLENIILSFDKAIICTGSSTFIPPISGLVENSDIKESTVPFLTNKNIFSLKEVPESITIIGNGPIGVELSEAFLHLGSTVNLIGNTPNIMPRSEQDFASKLQENLTSKGLNHISGNTVKIEFEEDEYKIFLKNGEVIKSKKLLIATGRKPNLPDGLKNAGVKYNSRGIECNNKGETSNKSILVAGDVALGYPNFTHYAGHMGGVITTNLAVQKYTKLPLNISKFKTNAVPAITFTSPELAECGLTEKLAIDKYGKANVKSYTFNFKDLDRAKAQGHEEGSIKLVTKGFFGKIVGVHILASRGGEILPELQRLVNKQSSIFSLSKIIRAYPSYTANLDSLFKEWIVDKISKK